MHAWSFSEATQFVKRDEKYREELKGLKKRKDSKMKDSILSSIQAQCKVLCDACRL